MKKSTIRIRANILKGIMEFRGEPGISKYSMECIGFSMDKSRGSALVRYFASDGHIGITGTCGEVVGHRLPKGGVTLPPEIYTSGTKISEDLTLVIDHGGSVTTIRPFPGGAETRVKFSPKWGHAPVLNAIPAQFGGVGPGKPGELPGLLLNCDLFGRVMKGLSTILGGRSEAIRLTFFGEAESVFVFTSTDPEFDFVAAQMPMSLNR